MILYTIVNYFEEDEYRNMFKKSIAYLAMPPLAVCSALNYVIFVFPNSFAPSGVDGICTMIQYLLNTNMGYLSLLFNIPLLFAAWFLVCRDFVVKTLLYTLTFSVAVIVLEYVNVSAFAYHTETGTSVVLAPLVAGIVRGVLYAVTIKLGGSSGGVDIVAAIVKRFQPQYHLMSIIFALNAVVAGASYFVYGFKIEPVVCSLLYAFTTSAVSRHIEEIKREQIRFEIITADAYALCARISSELRQTATVVEARGAYSGTDKKMVICVTDKKRVPVLEKILHAFPDTVTFESMVKRP